MKISEIRFEEKILIVSTLSYLLDEGVLEAFKDVYNEDMEELARKVIEDVKNTPSDEIMKGRLW